MDAMKIEKNLRQSNIELCRIFAMLLIVLLHSTYASFGYPESLDRSNGLVLLFSSLSIYGVDVFLLISGYFGIKAKKNSLVNMLFICLFAAVCRFVLDFLLGSFNYKNVFFLSRSNWFVISYIGLLILSPVLNSFIENATKKHMGILIVAFYFYSFYFSIFPAQAPLEPGFNHGCSVIWFAEVYLIGRYFKLYGIPRFMQKNSIVSLIASIMLIFAGQVLLISLGFHNKLSWWGAQNQPLVLIAAMSFFIIFTKVHMQSAFINRVAQSTLMVLLIHSPGLTKEWFHFINLEYDIMHATILWLVGVSAVYIACTIIDQVRLFVYTKVIKNSWLLR